MIKKILGFDISSACIGIGLISLNTETNEIKFESVECLEPIQGGSILDRLYDTKIKILNIIKKINPDEIAIENIISFMKGSSTANTIITLTSFNRMICLLSYDFLNKAPTLYNVMSIRHALKLNKDLPSKEDMPSILNKHLNINFPLEYDKNGKVKETSLDMSDSVCVALMHAFVLTNKIKAPKTEEEKKQEKKNKKNRKKNKKR